MRDRAGESASASPVIDIGPLDLRVIQSDHSEYAEDRRLASVSEGGRAQVQGEH